MIGGERIPGKSIHHDEMREDPADHRCGKMVNPNDAVTAAITRNHQGLLQFEWGNNGTAFIHHAALVSGAPATEMHHLIWQCTPGQQLSFRFAFSLFLFCFFYCIYGTRTFGEQRTPTEGPAPNSGSRILIPHFFKTINKMIFMKKFDPFKNCTPTHLFITVPCFSNKNNFSYKDLNLLIPSILAKCLWTSWSISISWPQKALGNIFLNGRDSIDDIFDRASPRVVRVSCAAPLLIEVTNAFQ